MPRQPVNPVLVAGNLYESMPGLIAGLANSVNPPFKVIKKDRFYNVVLFPPSLVFYVLPHDREEDANAEQQIEMLEAFARMHATKNRHLLVVQQPSLASLAHGATNDTSAWSDMLQLHTLGRLPLYTIHNSQFVRAGDAANDMILQFKISKRQEEVQTRGIATVQQHHAEQPAAIIGEFTALCKSLNNMQAGAAAQCYPTIRDLFLQDPAMVQRIVDNSRLEPHAAGRLGRLTAQDHVA